MATLKAELILRNGEKKVFAEPSSNGALETDLGCTRTSILKIQKDVNDALTELINAEISSANIGGEVMIHRHKHKSSSSSDEEDDEDEDEDLPATRNSDSEPVPKKLKA